MYDCLKLLNDLETNNGMILFLLQSGDGRDMNKDFNRANQIEKTSISAKRNLIIKIFFFSITQDENFKKH